MSGDPAEPHAAVRRTAEAYQDARSTAVYDDLEGHEREDLAVYSSIAREFGARRVVDIGCGTGTFAILLAREGIDVVGVDPSAPSIALARSKQGAQRVHFVHGFAPDLLSELDDASVDMAFMTANVAQEFLTDDDWTSTLEAIHELLTGGGRLVFETRDPARRAWEEWTKDRTFAVLESATEGRIESWVQVTSVDGEFVTFEGPTIFIRDGARIDSTSTLRFRSREAIIGSLEDAGFDVNEIRDAPDRPGREFVFVASKNDSHAQGAQSSAG